MPFHLSIMPSPTTSKRWSGSSPCLPEHRQDNRRTLAHQTPDPTFSTPRMYGLAATAVIYRTAGVCLDTGTRLALPGPVIVVESTFLRSAGAWNGGSDKRYFIGRKKPPGAAGGLEAGSLKKANRIVRNPQRPGRGWCRSRAGNARAI
jgi:hypothetical protein